MRVDVMLLFMQMMSCMQMKAYANRSNIPPVCYASQFFNALMVSLVVVESEVEKQAKNERNLKIVQ